MKIPRHATPRHAFSLVELSIVLVILGLLTGGILSGQSLIRAAELRSVTTDFNRYQTSINTFRDKYFALPGDMTNATAFWGIAGGTTGNDNACYDATSTDAKTCNGNGDGQILGYTLARINSEPNRAWQQLANAGLIEGQYNGQAGAVLIAGTTSPQGRISSSGYFLVYVAYTGSYGENFSSDSNGNQLIFGVGGGAQFRNPALKPEEAWNIDTKIDDGKPSTGVLQTDTFFGTACYTGAYPTAVYALTTSSIACNLRLTLR
ncbi:MAG: type II secretion system protein [Rickettsiales bacterium]